MTDDDSPAFTATDLTKRYRLRTALDRCTVSVPRGAIVGLVGPNGAGKSTFLQLACGLIRPTSGDIRVLGTVPGSTAEHLQRVGFVAQDTPTYSTFTVGEHLTMGRRLNRSWDGELALDRIRHVGLDLRQRAGRLSGGQRAQLALAVAAGKRPELLILDEPAAALDPIARRGFITNLVDFVRALGATAILSSHLMEDVESACDHLVVLSRGRLQVAGAVDDLLREHRLLELSSADAARLPQMTDVISTYERSGRVHAITRAPSRAVPPHWEVQPVSVRDLALAYMGRSEPAGDVGVEREAAR